MLVDTETDVHAWYLVKEHSLDVECWHARCTVCVTSTLGCATTPGRPGDQGLICVESGLTVSWLHTGEGLAVNLWCLITAWLVRKD
jgi:hypothetical protein